MYDSTEPPPAPDPIADLASDVLTELYRAVCGHAPRAVRAYHDDDALLILVRFDPAHMSDIGPDGFDQLLDGAFVAMPGMIASALEARTGRRMVPGNLSVCEDRGLAVFAFNAADETQDEDTNEEALNFEDALARAAQGRPALRLAG